MVSTDVLVVGAGPAGLTTGIYASRFGHRVIILEKSFAGGQLAMTSEVENYPGFAEPVSGLLLAETMQLQAVRFGCQMVNAEATAVTAGQHGFAVTTPVDRIAAQVLVICTGAKPRKLNVPGEAELIGRGVSYCAVCDGPLFKGREVAVVGGGDSALDEALYLSNICARVHMIHRRDEFRGCKTAEARLRQRENVVFHLSTVIESVNGTDRIESLQLRDLKDDSRRRLAVNGLFIYVGWLPNTGWCSGFVRLDGDGAVIADERLRTSVTGVFAAGDVRNTPLRQVATAVGDGALAAMMAHDFLSGRR